MKTRKRMTVGQFNTWFEVLRFGLAIFIAFAISFIIMSFSTDSPFAAIGNLFIGPMTSVRRFSTVLETMIPLTFAGLAVNVMFKANQFNLAAEGALFMGALMSAIIAIYMPGPPIMVIIAGMIAAGIVGSLVCAIPGILKIKWNCSEMVISLMLNYVMLYFGTYIFNQVARDPDSAYKASYTFREGVNLGNIIPRTRLHAGIFIVAVFVILTYIFMFKTKWGYKLRVTGSNIHFAKCAGISVAGVIMSSQLIGGFIAGVGGSTEMLGMYSRFQWSSLPGYGFDGVILNILAKENPAYVPVAAFFVAYLRIGADYMYKQSDVAAEIVAIIEGLVIVLVAATAFLSKFRHKMTTKVSKNLLEAGGAR
ncbi:simple sugar transport system permease protein [Kineothrix alysoides]|uniref:Simple sugar transport system permease protein n=1 Tax=Kineothrix alysoides TaxID=1469948 RepID=A0A4R1QVG2_9FIRM|nr:ABC transporter permease [Kineothrix alysoides]TCL57959.1 simple sugar transport system permease protein [Kineothrix alysoides]